TFAPGNHTITASYAGSSDFFPAVSAPLKITIIPATIIDVMVLYTAAALNQAGGASDIHKIIDDSILGANQAFLNSHIPVALRAVHVDSIRYRESGKLHTDLNRLQRPHDGFMDDAPRMRDTYGADLVSLLESDGDRKSVV